MSPDKLPNFITDIISAVPRHGEGVHKWMYSLSRYLHAFRSHDEIVEILRIALHDCGRQVPEREIQAAVKDSKAAAWVPGVKNDIVYQPPWPAFDQSKYNLITSDGVAAYDLWEQSPVRFMDDASYTEDIIDAMFPGNPFLCCGLSSTVFDCKKRKEWRGELEKQQFIVPSACLAEYGYTKDGKVSAHCVDNTGPRQYLVIEQDKGDQDQQCAVITYLRDEFEMPLTLVLSSGGKSLHAWFNCSDISEKDLKKFMKHAVSLGADDATWTRSQFVRMPDGTRDNGKRQHVFYCAAEMV